MTSLRQRMLEDMQVRQLSPSTRRTYVQTIARFAQYFRRSPARLGPAQIRAYQVYLATWPPSVVLRRARWSLPCRRSASSIGSPSGSGGPSTT